ncbi:MAG: hypothetical protein HYR96_01800 [Deltaproteobacteria bacterium]|nr:hypothetical protein [Deltaproteobacteria bacterium]
MLWTIPLLLAVMALNHAEEIILTALASAAILIGHWYEKAPAPKRRLFLRAFLIACILSAVAGWVAMRINGYFFIAHIRNTVPELTRYGSLKIWSRTGPFADTIGISGVVSLLLALVFFRQFPIEGALTIAPFFVVLCPATALLLCWLMPTGYILYRIFYVLPFGFILVSSLLRALPFWAAGLLVAALAFPPAFPWRGRLAFLLYRAPAVREFTHLDQTARWIKENRPGILTCELITDDITDWVVSTHLGRNFSRANRLAPRLLTQKLDTTEKILDHAQKHKACGVLVARRSELPAETPSRAARLSHHWDENKGDQSWQISAEFEAAAAGLTNNHWTQIPVPPFYNLYEPVDHVRNHGKEFYPRSDHP